MCADGDHRNGTGVGLRHRQGEIQCARSERGQADARFAGEMALRGGHEARSLLMAGQYETYASIAFQGFHQRDVLFAGNAINDVYAFVDQAFDEQVCDIAHMFVAGEYVPKRFR